MKRFLVLFIAALVLVSCDSTITTPTTETTTLSTVATPVIIPSGGKIIVTDTVSITLATSGAAILYTLDGSDPTTSSKVYTGPIKVSEGSLVVKAMGYQAGAYNSPIVTAAFTVSMPVNRWIKNSTWAIKQTAYVPTGSKDLTTDAELAGIVATHNATATDDKYFLLTEDTPVTLAPTAEVWIVNASTFYQYRHYTDVLRENVEHNEKGWRLELSTFDNAILYVDIEPPAYIAPPPPPVDPRPDYEKYAIYALDSAGAIMIETHCEDYDPVTMSAETKAQYFARRVIAFQSDVNQHQGAKSGEPWSLISGQLYAPPSE